MAPVACAICVNNSALGAEPIAQPDGVALLRYDPRWQDRRAQRLREQLRTEGYFEHDEAGVDSALSGLRHAGQWAWRCALSNAQWQQLYQLW